MFKPSQIVGLVWTGALHSLALRVKVCLFLAAGVAVPSPNVPCLRAALVQRENNRDWLARRNRESLSSVECAAAQTQHPGLKSALTELICAVGVGTSALWRE